MRLSRSESGCAEERNAGELHCEEADSCSMDGLKDCCKPLKDSRTNGFCLSYSTNALVSREKGTSRSEGWEIRELAFIPVFRYRVGK